MGPSEIGTEVGGCRGCCSLLGTADLGFCRGPLCPMETAVPVGGPEDLRGQLHVVEEEVHARAKRSLGGGCRSLYSSASAPAELHTYSCVLSLFHSYVELVAFFSLFKPVM